ncbi:MAG: histidinol-phosphate transaminase [Leptospiraceae bacterium]|nr:histidinol-phosphate transaminase [Leptospiraceae bacterium]
MQAFAGVVEIQDLLSLLPSRIRKMEGYVPGLQKNDPEIIKLNSNENPYPPSEAVRHALLTLANSAQTPLQKYPAPTAGGLRRAIESRYGLAAGSVLAGNGSDEVLALLFRALLDPGQSFVIARPTYSLYPVLAAATGLKCLEVPLKEDFHMDFSALLKAAAESNSSLIVLAMPNAPTGLSEKKEELEDFIRSFPGWIILDEAYAPFGDVSFMSRAGGEFSNLICTSTFSKAWSLAGLRVGWMAAHPDLIQEVDKIRDSYNLSRAAQMAATAAIEDVDWQKENARKICATRERLATELKSLGFECLESSANFIFARVPSGTDEEAKRIQQELENRKILIRYFSSEPIRSYLRISIGTDKEMDRLLAELDNILKKNPEEA